MESNLLSVLHENIFMMEVNILLAIIPILFGWLILKIRSKILKVVFAVIWLSFLPNTLYILTDLRYMPEQWNELNYFSKIILAIQYLFYEIIGFVSFIIALYPLEKLFLTSQLRSQKQLLTFLLIMTNFLIGFGIVLGRVQRINSWDIFVDISKVINASLQILSSLELMLLVLLFGFLGNSFYFLFRKYRRSSAALVSKRR